MLGKNAQQHAQRIQEKRKQANELLEHNARELARLRNKVEEARQQDPSLRCALPLDDPSAEPLDAHYPLPPLPAQATLIAADGSQINPDRHAAVNYCLINVGAIRMRHGSSEPPQPFTLCRLLYDEQLYTATGTLTEEMVALMRDLNERRYLVELAEGRRSAGGHLHGWPDGAVGRQGRRRRGRVPQAPGRVPGDPDQAVRTGGDHRRVCGQARSRPGGAPAGNRQVSTVENLDDNIRKQRPLRGVTDIDLYRERLESGERSAVFAIQSRSLEDYRGDLALRFFYLNVGLPDDPWLARVEVPAWVAADAQKLNNLHAVLINQCRIMGGRPYPYLLHRAHETAVVTLAEKEAAHAHDHERDAAEQRARGP